MQALEVQKQQFDDTLAKEREGFRQNTVKLQDRRRLSHERHEQERNILQREAADMVEQLRRSQLLCRMHDELRSLFEQRVLAAADRCLHEKVVLQMQLDAIVLTMTGALRTAELELSEVGRETARPYKLGITACGAAVLGAAAAGAMAAVAVMRGKRSQ